MDEKIKDLIDNNERWLCKHISHDFLNKSVKKTNLNLKIALQLGGGLRNFKYTIPWLNHFIVEPLDADVFVHGWANNLGVSQNEIDVLSYKNLKKYKINDINDSKFNFLKKENKLIEKIHGNFFNTLECNALRLEYEKENNIKYDFVIKTRPDAYFFSEFDDVDIEYSYNTNKIAIPLEYFRKLWCPYITDVFAMAPSEIMNNYCDAFYSIDESIKVNGIGPESTIHYHILTKMHGITIHNIYPNFILDYPQDADKDLLDSVNTRFNDNVKIFGADYSF